MKPISLYPALLPLVNNKNATAKKRVTLKKQRKPVISKAAAEAFEKISGGIRIHLTVRSVR